MFQPLIKPNEDATQICPVLLFFATITGGSTVCMKERCAWWNESTGACGAQKK